MMILVYNKTAGIAYLSPLNHPCSGFYRDRYVAIACLEDSEVVKGSASKQVSENEVPEVVRRVAAALDRVDAATEEEFEASSIIVDLMNRVAVLEGYAIKKGVSWRDSKVYRVDGDAAVLGSSEALVRKDLLRLSKFVVVLGGGLYIAKVGREIVLVDEVERDVRYLRVAEEGVRYAYLVEDVPSLDDSEGSLASLGSDIAEIVKMYEHASEVFWRVATEGIATSSELRRAIDLLTGLGEKLREIEIEAPALAALRLGTRFRIENVVRISLLFGKLSERGVEVLLDRYRFYAFIEGERSFVGRVLSELPDNVWIQNAEVELLAYPAREQRMKITVHGNTSELAELLHAIMVINIEMNEMNLYDGS